MEEIQLRRKNMQRCYGCMREFGKQYEVCPHCGYIVETEPESKSHLVPGTVLAGRYMLGKVLGHGGFGITYIAWDSKINKTVAIKEYFPNAFSTRSAGETQVSCYNSKAEKFLRQGIEKMLDEARRVSKFSKNENIVDIYDFFEENNTAYIVMEYLEGRDLKIYLEENGGKLTPDKAVELMLPVLNALEDMHKENIIHRDISPDNIFLCESGKVKLLDFGSARLAVEDSDKSLSVMIKRGYAPREQYSSRSKQGTWTDVYAVCATLYKMITGELPTESTERDEEPLKKFSEFGIKDCSDLEKVVFKGLEVSYTDRIQTVTELRNALLKATQKKPAPVVAETPKKQDAPLKAEIPKKAAAPEKPVSAKQTDIKKQPEKKTAFKFDYKILLVVAAVIVFGVGIAFGINALKSKPDTTDSDANASTSAATTAAVEAVNIALNEAETKEIYERFLKSDEMKSAYTDINAVINKDYSLFSNEDISDLELDLLDLNDLSDSVLKKHFYDFDSDGTNEMLVSLDPDGEEQRANVYLFDIDKNKNVFAGAVWKGLASSRTYNHMTVMKADDETYYFIEFSSDGLYGKDCEKLIYNGTELKREFSLSVPDYKLLGYSAPDFRKCSVQNKTLSMVSSVNAEYPEENEIENLSYEQACKEWNELFSAERIVGFCDLSRSDLMGSVKISDKGEINDTIIWKLYENGYLSIEGMGAIPDYGTPWEENSKIKYVYISSGINTIGERAFGGCNSLREVMISEGVEFINQGVFSGCALEYIYIPKTVEYIASDVFSGCSELTGISVDVESIYYSSDDSGVLFNKNKTELLHYPNGREENHYDVPDTVIEICSGSFAGCKNLNSITIPRSVTTIHNDAFMYCTNISEITLSENVRYVEDYTFEGWGKDQKIIIENTPLFVERNWESNWDIACNANIIYAKIL